ncbi:WhiB family transcriptional regulator [Brachybacterium sp. JHP9]|uniref:Transcriptional regulator WhiB n=1 Tax=Brachybacterium equifaecis TaxID=2910770 RepID=A0ABT0QY86_9MICO|nr:WhiB family transcriptional regulator [Brachybacterium equifaecis]MCL6421984.1 WhiB family transcriptional regulator [Brachybacterium equifaecis]
MTDILIRTPACVPDDPTPVLPCQSAQVASLYFSERPAELESAKSLCGPCPLRAECLEGALRRAEPWGVWGGEILENGRVIAVKRGRGRPRKDAAAA